MADIPNADVPYPRPNAFVNEPDGIAAKDSEVMQGAYWSKAVTVANMAVKAGIIAIPQSWLDFAGDPATIQFGLLTASLVGDGVNWLLAKYIEYGRRNGGQALSPLKE